MKSSKAYTFSAKIDITGINPFVSVSAYILKSIFTQAKKDKGHIPIKGTINGGDYRQTLVKYSGEWRLYDTDSRDVAKPPEFEKALMANKEASLAFERLTAYRKKEMLRHLGNLKTKESLERNIAKAINFLNGKEAFLGRGPVN